MKHAKYVVIFLLLLAILIAGCSEKSSELSNVTVVLDWTPNTNHTGLYIARENGFFEEEGLNVEIIIPGEAGAAASVAAGNAHFGIGTQEGVTQARVAGLPIVSIAAVIQHNTSGFASPVDRNITSPADFEGKSYGGWGDPVEEAVISSLMKAEDADVNQVEMMNIGWTDFLTAVERDIDFKWIFYAWEGILAEINNVDINMIFVSELSDQLDYYTPVIITNEQMIDEEYDVVKAFMAATSKGYSYAIENPEDAANILLMADPDLDEALVSASQQWLSPRYQGDAPRWGEQKREVWEGYTSWMMEYDLLQGEFDIDHAFTNEFLPQ